MMDHKLRKKEENKAKRELSEQEKKYVESLNNFSNDWINKLTDLQKARIIFDLSNQVAAIGQFLTQIKKEQDEKKPVIVKP